MVSDFEPRVRYDPDSSFNLIFLKIFFYEKLLSFRLRSKTSTAV